MCQPAGLTSPICAPPLTTTTDRARQIRILKDDPRVKLANQVNLASALRVALLTLPETFTERELYERIAGLSYSGAFALPPCRFLPALPLALATTRHPKRALR